MVTHPMAKDFIHPYFWEKLNFSRFIHLKMVKILHSMLLVQNYTHYAEIVIYIIWYAVYLPLWFCIHQTLKKLSCHYLNKKNISNRRYNFKTGEVLYDRTYSYNVKCITKWNKCYTWYLELRIIIALFYRRIVSILQQHT